MTPRTASLVMATMLLAACSSAGGGPSVASPSAGPAASSGDTSPTTTPIPQAAATGTVGTPMPTVLDGVQAQMIPLGADTAPIDVVDGFGSIWVANHHAGTVTRLNPDTLAEEARVWISGGPGWFAVTDDAVWVTNQMGSGLTRIDPATNTAGDRAGKWPTCWGPVFAFDAIWQAACDAHVIMKIDPATFEATDIPTTGHSEGIARFGDVMIAMGPDGLARLDPVTLKLTTIGGCCGHLAGADDTTVWLADEQQVYRIDPATGKTMSTLPITFAGVMRAYGDHAWMIQESTAALKIDLATNEILQTLPVRPEPIVALEAEGAVWVTSFGGDALWRLEP